MLTTHHEAQNKQLGYPLHEDTPRVHWSPYLSTFLGSHTGGHSDTCKQLANKLEQSFCQSDDVKKYGSLSDLYGYCS